MNRNHNLDRKILNIVQNFTIYYQSELQSHLKQNGCTIAQATLSRYLKNLNIAKIGGKYQIVRYNNQYTPSIRNIEISEFGLIILHTNPGDANSLAALLDKKYIAFHTKDKKHQQILGIISGDDTVLLIAKNNTAANEFTTLLKNDFPYLE